MTDKKPSKADEEEYELIYDRVGCIGAASCVAVFPEQWSLADDGLADFKKKSFSKEELERNLEAAKSCPVNVIRIKNKKTGEFIY